MSTDSCDVSPKQEKKCFLSNSLPSVLYDFFPLKQKSNVWSIIVGNVLEISWKVSKKKKRQKRECDTIIIIVFFSRLMSSFSYVQKKRKKRKKNTCFSRWMNRAATHTSLYMNTHL